MHKENDTILTSEYTRIVWNIWGLQAHILLQRINRKLLSRGGRSKASGHQAAGAEATISGQNNRKIKRVSQLPPLCPVHPAPYIKIINFCFPFLIQPQKQSFMPTMNCEPFSSICGQELMKILSINSSLHQIVSRETAKQNFILGIGYTYFMFFWLFRISYSVLVSLIGPRMLFPQLSKP